MISLKNTPKYIFLAAALIIGCSIAANKGDSLTSAPGEDVKERTAEVDNSLWVDSYRLREGRWWIRISEEGSGLYVQFGTPGTKQLKEVRTGKISLSETKQLFSLLDEINFFELEDQQPEDVVEADLLTVGACQGGKCHEVSTRPPTAIPEQLGRLVTAVENHISTLEAEEGNTVLISAHVLDPSHVQELKGRGQTFVPYDVIDDYGPVRIAVEHPGQFVQLRSEVAENLQEEVEHSNYFYVSLSNQSMGIDFYSFNDAN